MSSSKFSRAIKIKIVEEAMLASWENGFKGIQQVCKNYGISKTTYYEWKSSLSGLWSPSAYDIPRELYTKLPKEKKNEDEDD